MTQFLFCFLGGATKNSAPVNQRRHVAVCRSIGCTYLDESQAEPVCTHEENLNYIEGLLVLSKPMKKGKED